MQDVLKKQVWIPVAILLLVALCVLVPDGKILQAAQNALFARSELPEFTFAVQPYGAFLAGGALAAFLVSLWLCRREVKAADGIRFFALSLCFGLVFARVLYCVTETAYYNETWAERLAFLRIQDGGMLMTGAMLGMLLAGVIVKPAKKMIPFAFPVFVCFERIGELFTQLGIGPKVSFLNFLSRKASKYVINLNLNLVEALAAVLLLAAVLAFRKQRGIPFMLFLYGSVQVLMESLRQDRHVMWGFVKFQQIAVIVTALLCLTAAARTRKGALKALALTLPAAGILIALEFALDKTDIQDWIIYAVYIAVLGAYIWLGLRMFFKVRDNDAETMVQAG